MKNMMCTKCGKEIDVEEMITQSDMDCQMEEEFKQIEPQDNQHCILLNGYCPHCGKMYFVYKWFKLAGVEICEPEDIALVVYDEEIKEGE